MINHGKIFEDKVEVALVALKLPYTREGSKRSYGVRGSNKGKFDFWVNNKIAIECKSIDRASNLRLPWPGLTNTAIKSHQLKALRHADIDNALAGLLIEVRSSRSVYWLNIRWLDSIVQEFGMIPALSIEVLEKRAYKVYDLGIFLDMMAKREEVR